LLFSAKVPNSDGVLTRPDSYLIGTYIFEAVAYLGASTLCLKNWLSPQLVGNRNIWLSIGLGMFSYFIGGLIFDYLELYSVESPNVSWDDLFFVLTYVLLSLGLILAILSRRISLSWIQWLIIVAIGLLGCLLSLWIYQQTPDDNSETPLALTLNYFYIVSDIFLLISATTLLLAFWGGKISSSWRMIAAAAFSLYIADTWYSYARSIQGDSYQSGELLEVFWIVSGVLFGISAALEYEISLSRKRRNLGKK
jgi:hypothetical protein